MARRELPEDWKTLMDQKGYSSIRRLAEAAKVQHTTVMGIIYGGVHQPKASTMQAVADALGVPLSRIEQMSGYTADTTEPWTPPEYSGHLTLEERAALDQIIRVMTANRIPKGRDKQDDPPSNVHPLRRRNADLHPQLDGLNVAADSAHGPSEGQAMDDWFDRQGEEDQT